MQRIEKINLLSNILLNLLKKWQANKCK